MQTIVEAFDDVDLVALGERHWSRQHSEFRLALIRDPAFAQYVNDIVIEFGNPRYQPMLPKKMCRTSCAKIGDVTVSDPIASGQAKRNPLHA